MNPRSELYTVRKNDTLTKIAREHGTTVDDIQKLNGIENPRTLREGQKIALDKEAVGGFRVLFLDKDRNPIPNLTYRLEANGKTYTGKSSASGETKRIITDSPFDLVFIWVQRIDKTWKKLRTVMSGFGDKLAVMVSGHMAIPAKTEKHPDLPPGNKPDARERAQPRHAPDKASPPTLDKKDLGPKATPSKTPDGKPLTTVEGDLAALNEFLDEFNGELMNDADYAWAAKELGVEEAVVRAYAKVESGADKGGGYITIGKRKVPTILYERHKFSKLTNHQFSSRYPDISLPAGYYVQKATYVPADEDYKRRHGVPMDVQYYRPVNKSDSQTTKDSAVALKDMLANGTATVPGDTYLKDVANYKRLVKAFQLEKKAALESCSWGAFQILGEYWDTMGYSSIFDFTKAMSRSEREQIKAFVRYIKKVNPAIIGYLNKHNWARAAEAYNGPSYKQNSYDEKLATEYKKFVEKK